MAVMGRLMPYTAGINRPDVGLDCRYSPKAVIQKNSYFPSLGLPAAMLK